MEVNSQVYPEDKAGPVELATMTFGHGIANTPVQVTTAIAAIVNGGYLLEPHIIKHIEDENGNIIEERERVVKRQVISNVTSTQMRDIMRSVVDNGSGKSVYMEGLPLGAKTGTSEKFVNGKYSGDKVIASFIAVAPIEDPKIALYIFVDEPQDNIFGSVVAAPIAKTILTDVIQYLGIERTFEASGSYIELPDFVGLSIEEIEKIVKDLDVELIYNQSESLNVEKIVVNQFPKAGTYIEADSSVYLQLLED